MIALPNFKDTKIVSDIHYSGVTTNIIGKGVIKDISKFEILIDAITKNKNRTDKRKIRRLEERNKKKKK